VSKPKKEVEIGPCSYCGVVGEVEPDHVVPQGLFYNPNQATIIIPSCQECNREKGAGENDLRDFMVFSKGSHGHPTAMKVLKTIAEATSKGMSKLGKAATEQRSWQPHFTSAGIYLGHELAIPFEDPKPMMRSLHYMVRGLYFHEYGVRWPAESPHDVTLIPDYDFRPTLSQMARLSTVKRPKSLGRNVFWYVPIKLGDLTDPIGWVMVFYDGICVIGNTGIEYEDDDEEEKKIVTFQDLLKRRGKRADRLRGMVDHRALAAPPKNMLDFLGWYEEKKRETPLG
jgi:hypothetical protein